MCRCVDLARCKSRCVAHFCAEISKREENELNSLNVRISVVEISVVYRRKAHINTYMVFIDKIIISGKSAVSVCNCLVNNDCI